MEIQTTTKRYFPQGLEAEETPSSDVGSSEPKRLDLTQIDFEPNSRVSLLADGDKVPRMRVVEQARQSGAVPVLKRLVRPMSPPP